MPGSNRRARVSRIDQSSKTAPWPRCRAPNAARRRGRSPVMPPLSPAATMARSPSPAISGCRTHPFRRSSTEWPKTKYQYQRPDSQICSTVRRSYSRMSCLRLRFLCVGLLASAFVCGLPAQAKLTASMAPEPVAATSAVDCGDCACGACGDENVTAAACNALCTVMVGLPSEEPPDASVRPKPQALVGPDAGITRLIEPEPYPPRPAHIA